MSPSIALSWEQLLNPVQIDDSTPGPRQTRGSKAKYPSSSTLNQSDDSRSPFMKDFDNICNSSFFRRLQDKAQVFPLERGDFSRTRLTHSMEVMSLAESLGIKISEMIIDLERAAGRELSRHAKPLVKEIPFILKSAALLHDLGNPPFGHIGEDIISKWFKDNLSNLYVDTKGKLHRSNTSVSDQSKNLASLLSPDQCLDLLHFDGNAQVLRIVSSLDNSPAPTCPVVATVIKYPYDRATSFDWRGNAICEDENNEKGEKGKKGYFYTEAEIYDKIQNELGLKHKRHPLVFLLEACDDISYLLSDLEDAVRKGLIDYKKISSKLKQLIGDPNNKDKLSSLQLAQTALDQSRNNVQRTSFGDPKTSPNYSQSQIEHEAIRLFRKQMRGYMLNQSTHAFRDNYDSIMCGEFTNELLKCGNLQPLRQGLSELLVENVYFCPSISASKVEACKIIVSLLESIIFSVFNQRNDGKNDDRDSLIYNMLSGNFKKNTNFEVMRFCDIIQQDTNIAESNKAQSKLRHSTYCKLRLVIDVITGMTDTYAMDTYNMINVH